MFTFLAFILIIGLGVLFYALWQRVETLTATLDNLSKDQRTLFTNQAVLEKDLHRLYNEFKAKKKIRSSK